MSPISLLKQDDDSNQELINNKSDDPRDSTLTSDIKDDDVDCQRKVLLLGQVHWDKMLRTTRVPQLKKHGCADIVIAHPPHTNSTHTARAMAPTLLKRQKLSFFNNLSMSNHAPSTQALPLRKSSGEQIVPQPKAYAGQNVLQYQKATFEVAKYFMKAIIFTMTPWPMISDEK